MAVYNVIGKPTNSVFNAAGTQITQAYDKNGGKLIFDVAENQDASTGNSSGYSLTADESQESYVLRMLADFNSPYQIVQYFGHDYDNKKFYKFDGTTAVDVFNSEISKTNTITLSETSGHNNDGCYYNGKFYLASGYFSVPLADATKLYVWDIAENTVSVISVSGISQPSNRSKRAIWGVCEAEKNSGKLYLGCIDTTGDALVHATGDKLSIYEYNIATGACRLLAELPWDCVYLQGITAYNGILYAACNTQTTGSASNYAGITVKCIRTDTWELVDTLACAGTFEPEGMDVIPVGTSFELFFGMNHYNTMGQVVRFTPPFKLVYAN